MRVGDIVVINSHDDDWRLLGCKALVLQRLRGKLKIKLEDGRIIKIDENYVYEEVI